MELAVGVHIAPARVKNLRSSYNWRVLFWWGWKWLWLATIVGFGELIFWCLMRSFWTLFVWVEIYDGNWVKNFGGIRDEFGEVGGEEVVPVFVCILKCYKLKSFSLRLKSSRDIPLNFAASSRLLLVLDKTSL